MSEGAGSAPAGVRKSLTYRIVSMIPSSTEIVCALGYGDSLVARSHECDYPAYVTSLPIVTKATLDCSKSSREIDDQVKSRLTRALSIYEVDVPLLNELRPDVIVTQSQCEVCAVSENEVERALCEFTGTLPKLVSCAPMELKNIWEDIERVALALGDSRAGTELTRRLRARMAESASRVAASLASEPRRVRVACVEWIDPLMSAGNWVPELVEIAGGDNLFGEAGKHSPWMKFEDLVRADPDVIVVMPCGFDINRSRAEMAPLVSEAGWDNLKAVKQGRVVVVDGNQYFNRPGPRIVESLDILIEVINPHLSEQSAFEGHGWQKL